MSQNFESLAQNMPHLSILRQHWPTYSELASTHVVTVHNVAIGESPGKIIAGPCAVESYEQTSQLARSARDAGAVLLRGGAFKPRTNPNSFQGLGIEGLQILRQIKIDTGLGIVTEVMDPRLVEITAEYADMLQIGTRSMYNYPLLQEVGKMHRPVLLKRGWCATLEEWLCAAEYLAQAGTRDIVLCERGIRTSCHWDYARTVLDLNILEPVKRLTPLPIIVDPSHATGQASLVPAMSRAALAGGAHGLIIEAIMSEQHRTNLQCDSSQGIVPEQLKSIIEFAKNHPWS